MVELGFLFLIITGSYAYSLKFWKKNQFRFSEFTSRYLKYLHYFTFVLSLSFVFIDYSLRGIWTSRIVIIISIFIGIFYNLIAQKSVLNKVEKYYFAFLSFFPILFFGLVLIPMICFIIVVSLIGQLFNPVDKIYYEDNKLRIQSSFVGVMAPPRIKVYKKFGIFEKQYKNQNLNFEDIDSIKVDYKNDTANLYIWYDYNENPSTPEEFKIKL
ncbi:hypothetical protein GFJ94_00210 [Flavobacterium sp. LMO8]|uniref:hypothetical protein n=1 Tax=Flavobacterium sp. LMO8 TaxID=2654244 RepID=UPI0012927250|nr:hypothetical protein [Flavobacterium sp. LMO8]MQP23487.1 hypothetical protein [Flavobacterium sp. LMO8]